MVRTITSNDLIDNASLFGREAVEHYLVRTADAGGLDWRFVSLFAATSIEQHLKALLTERNPLLVAEGEASMLILAGGTVEQSSPLRTISASVALQRAAAFVPEVKSFTQAILGLFSTRNGVVHLVEEEPQAFGRMFDAFLKVTELLLDDFDADAEVFWDTLEPVVAERLNRREATVQEQVERKLAIAHARYETKVRTLNPRERERLAMNRGGRWRVRGQNDYSSLYFAVECPVCGAQTTATGSVAVDWYMEDGEWRGSTSVTPLFLDCDLCSLELEGEEIGLAGIDLDLPTDIDPRDFSEPPTYEEVPELLDQGEHPEPSSELESFRVPE